MYRFVFSVLLLFLFYPEKCLMSQWSTKKAKKNFRFFVPVIQQKKKNYSTCFFFVGQKLVKSLVSCGSIKRLTGKLPFFSSVIQQEKTILLVFFWGAKTCQKSCKLGQHQEVKRKASVFFIQSITKKKNFHWIHSTRLIKLFKHLSGFEGE